MEKFTVRLAGHSICVESRYAENRGFFSDYIIPDETPEIIAALSDAELADTVSAVPGIAKEMAELTGLYRPIAEAMPHFGGFVFHGAAISYGGKGYVFSAPSGTGKSTHIRLWRKYLGCEVDIINGDKPIITAGDEGVLVHGTPWAGKERWQKNRSVPLGGICLLHRSKTCSVKMAEPSEFLPFLLGQTYYSQNPETVGKTMELLDSVLREVPVYSLYCDVSEDAVRCSFEAMCKEKYDCNKCVSQKI